MSIGLPEIIINFKQKAATAIERSQKGLVCMVVFDDTQKTFNAKTYNFATEVKTTDFTPENYAAIMDAFLGTPYKVIVVRVDVEETFADAVEFVSSEKFNWLCAISGVVANQQEVATYVKTQNSKTKTRQIKAVTFAATVTDDMHIVNFTNTKVKRRADAAEIGGHLYLGRLAGMLAGLPFTRSCTYYDLKDLERVQEPEDVATAIGEGEFVLVNDYGDVKISRGVNSLTTMGSNITEDMKKIAIIEGMDQILEDVCSSFKTDYLGKYKNKYDNQVLFISAVRGYFRELAKIEILDDCYDNRVSVDVEEQRNRWMDIGKAEASGWDENKIKNMTFKSYIFLMGNVKILDAMEDMEFNIYME